MSHNIFLTTKRLRVPTLWGWLLLFSFSAGACTLLIRNIYPFLALEQQATGAKLLIVEGWMAPTELDQAIARYRDGAYLRMITTGGPVPAAWFQTSDKSFALLAREYIMHHGISGDEVIAVPAPASAQDRTFLSAVMVREWLEHSGMRVQAIDVFSEGAHSRRTRLMYEIAFGNRVNIGIFAARPDRYDPSTWWRSSEGAKAVVTEAIGWLWTVLFFDTGLRGSHEEKWAMPPSGVDGTGSPQ